MFFRKSDVLPSPQREGAMPPPPPPGGALELDARSEGKGVEKKT